MRRCDLCGELFPEGALTGFIRYLGRYVKNIACKKCTEEHSVPKWDARSAYAGRGGGRKRSMN